MVDYFSYVSTIHNTQAFDEQTGDYVGDNQKIEGNLAQIKKKKITNDDFEIEKVMQKSKKIVTSKKKN